MSSGGFDAPHLPSSFPRYEPRRSSVSGLFDRPPPPVVPPSPNSARPYDRYVPAPVAGYREDYQVPYRPNAYRPEYPPNNLYPRSPSPDRYAAPGVEHWDRQNYWQSGAYNSRPPVNNGWPERKPVVPHSPTASVRGRGQVRDAATIATPMFEPSDNWRHKQGPERLYDPARQSVLAAHRPPPPMPARTEYDSYRPDPRNAFYPDPPSYRRDVPPAGISRWGDHYEPPRTAPPIPSRSHSPERRPNDRNLGSSPMQSDWRPKSNQVSRKSSRSSIASTHVSSSANANTVESSRHSRQNSDTVPRPGSSLSGAVNLYGHHRSPSIGIPGLSASLPAKPDPVSPRIPPKPITTSTNGTVPVAKQSDKPDTEDNKVNGEAPMEVDATKEEDVVRSPTPPKSESLSNGSLGAAQPPPSTLPEPTAVPSPDIEMAPADPEPSPPPTADDAAPEPPAIPEVPAPPPPKSPTPPPPWKDTSKVLLELKPLFPPDAPATEPPDLPSATTFADALRAVVKLRLISDRQTRDEIVERPLIANRAIAEMNYPPRWAPEGLDSTATSLIKEVLGGRGGEALIRAFDDVRPSLAEHFEKRQAMVTSKVERLSREYLELHEKWRAHCAALSEHQKSKMHTTEHEASLYVAGRTTRHRGALADAVRSDLEMEQIIASLESNDAMDPNYLSMKNAATIPDMISVVKGQVDYLFDDTNHLVENPQEYYAVKTGIDDWTDEEKRIFLDKFAQYPKQFGMIAQFIPHKTANQCVDYYYLHKKRHIDFRKVVAQLGPKKKRRGGGRKKKGNALLADIAQHDAEVGKLPSGFVVPSRVAKGRRGVGGRAKTSTAGAANSATATPQPEPRSARLQAQAAAQAQLAAEAAAASATNPSTPEPEATRSSRRKGKQVAATSASAPVSLSASISASSAPVSMNGPGPSPLGSATSSTAATPAMLLPEPPATPSGRGLLPSPAPTPAFPMISIPAAPPVRPPAIDQVASSQSGSSALTKMEEDDTLDLDTRPTKKAKRVRKQVKSVAIIHEEPPSPPPESELQTPDGEGLHEPSSVLSKTTKILSELEAKRVGSTSTSEKSKGKSRSRAKGKEKAKAKDAEGTIPDIVDLPEAEKNLFIDLLVRHGLDFQRIAAALPGRTGYELEKWYITNATRLRLNEAWQERLNAAQAAMAGAVIIRSPPPMASLTPHDIRVPVYPTHFTTYPTSTSQPSARPDYPMAIPFKPKSMQTTTNAAGGAASTNASGKPGQGPVHPVYHSPYGAHPTLSVPAYGYPYTPPPGAVAYYTQYSAHAAMQSRSHSHPGTPTGGAHTPDALPAVGASPSGPPPAGAPPPLGQPYYPPPGTY